MVIIETPYRYGRQVVGAMPIRGAIRAEDSPK